ncbi:MAG: cyclase family protein [Verrucomicrobia bacterium]|nr:cyclase family protein [Verrucomicrobiota bacterium]MBS0637510.1 cyclase family protein [Verrucomicrobiota bacterium]
MNPVAAIGPVVESSGVVPLRKDYIKNLPFIGDSTESVSRWPEYTNMRWVGVQCNHSEFVQSPHLTGTHVESARHVFGDGQEVKPLLKPYLGTLQARHVQIEAELIQIDQIESEGGVITFTFSSGDTYQLMQKEQFTCFPEDFVVTRAMLAKALGDMTEKVVLICLKGHEQTIHNWPYLTNQAIDLLVEKGVKIVGLNIPSFDRESDGGYTSNHKRFFADQTKLIVESLALETAPTGRVQFMLNPDISYDGACDTIPCAPTIVN